jgi:hypothetical protein
MIFMLCTSNAIAISENGAKEFSLQNADRQQ